jgi:hypothetical protein
MDEGLINKTDEELITAWKDRKNPQFSKDYIQLVREELLERGLFQGEMTQADAELMAEKSRIKKSETRIIARFLFSGGGRFILGITFVTLFFFFKIFLGMLRKDPSNDFEDSLLGAGYVVLSLFGFFRFVFRDLKNRVYGCVSFTAYLAAGTTAIVGGFLPIHIHFGYSEIWDVVWMSLAALLLTYLTDLLIPKLKQTNKGQGGTDTIIH